ncbi:hypothetical protein HanRHA438_Chr05g0236871 [Helianthus annuus]|nr:hypothetical protein HanRHA438_Chr05g0236871 [Helianthus annuus]
MPNAPYRRLDYRVHNLLPSTGPPAVSVTNKHILRTKEKRSSDPTPPENLFPNSLCKRTCREQMVTRFLGFFAKYTVRTRNLEIPSPQRLLCR